LAELLAFDKRRTYPDSLEEPGITLPIRLLANSREVEFPAKIDTGATFCLFERGYAEVLGIDVESGDGLRFQALGGSMFRGFRHEVTIVTPGLPAIQSYVYFSADRKIIRNVLGRHGWLDRIRLAIVHYDRELYLSPYD
jgi:hypothetical protein